jgi:hypothetical protein
MADACTFSAGMRALVVAAVILLASGCRTQPAPEVSSSSVIDLDQTVHLDAETLAEGGIAEAYESLRPRLQEYVPKPGTITEEKDGNGDRYLVRFRDREFLIYAPGIDTSQGQSWGRAMHALFTIVNDQLAESRHRLYAIDGANDLRGIFLTGDQVEAARKALPQRTDWPYLPTDEHPWYGQYH